MPDDLREIVTMGQMNRLFLILAILTPMVGVANYLLQSRRGSERASSIRASIFLGLLGPINFLLWNMYNAITDKLGLDSVRNLIINVVIFAAIGVVAGILLGRFTKQPDIKSNPKHVGPDYIDDGSSSG